MPTPTDPKPEDAADQPHHFKDDADVDAEAAAEGEPGASAAPEDDEPPHFRVDPTTAPSEQERDAD